MSTLAQARRAAAEAQRAEERRERQRRREATGDARSRGVKTSGAESDQPLGEPLASRDEVDTLSASLCAVMSRTGERQTAGTRLERTHRLATVRARASM